MKQILILLLLSSMIYADTIKIAIASNVSYASGELIAEFNKEYPDIKVQLTLGSSGKLTAQIKHGAPFDIFMSANMDFPNALYGDKLAITEPIVYAQGTLAIFSTQKVDFSKGIDIILDESIDKVAIANPKTAPYGKASKEALDNANIDIKPKLVYGESISQTVSYVMSAIDIGFIAKSSLYSPNMRAYKEGVNWIAVDTKLYTPINQGVVILKNAKDNKEAKAFYDFILSPKAKEIMKRYGYLVK